MITLFTACNYGDADDPGCTQLPPPDDYVEEKHKWLLHNKLGDTLLFNRYRIITDSTGRHYIYTGQEQYISTDTFTAHLSEYAYCDYFVNKFAPTVIYTGPGSLKYQLKPNGSFDHLDIYFEQKHYKISSLSYNYPSRTYHGFVVEGKSYNYVNIMDGFTIGAWGNSGSYKDSTVIFYNKDYGILKLIYDDTLALQRVLK